MKRTFKLRIISWLILASITTGLSGCGYVSKGVPMLKEMLKSGKSVGKYADDVDDIASASKNASSPRFASGASTAAQSTRVIMQLKMQYDRAYSEHEKENKLFASKRNPMHPDDQKAMEKRLSDNQSIFANLNSVLGTPEKLTEDAPSKITSFLSEFQTDTKGIQSLLSTL